MNYLNVGGPYDGFRSTCINGHETVITDDDLNQHFYELRNGNLVFVRTELEAEQC